MINFKKLLFLLVDMDMEPSDLCEACGVTSLQFTKLKQGIIDLKALDAICTYLEIQPTCLINLI